ncbi:carbamoyl-phosphate synthase L chain ATP-binding protein [Zopfochytrium polystomum]|nr:carbamoyl-phosphate synthase L chain ATP-binding protein [Zopfochytrium polystomum]
MPPPSAPSTATTTTTPTPTRRRIAKILIANRAEIAVRVIKTCRVLGISTVAVYTDGEESAPHVRLADEAVHIGPPQASESFLRIDKIIAACKLSGADAVHPGYGFLSENPDFARACEKNGIIFIGPRPESIEAIGDKISSKKLLAAKAPEVPLLPGYNGDDQSVERLTKEAIRIGFPVLLKASAGGGGKGMRIVRDANSIAEEIAAVQGEAKRSFGDSRLLVEKYIESARHIEVQIFGDQHGNVFHCFERECSVQRRHQKIIEETPSPLMTPSLRAKMTGAAVTIGSTINYVGAGTVEFIVDGAYTPGQDPKFYFLEVNTRLQVEHPISECITGLDFVELQIWVASGNSLDGRLSRNMEIKGHAIECRVYAEDPNNDFFPCTGTVKRWRPLVAPGLRYDSGITEGSEISINYDPMISKLIAHAPTRDDCIALMRKALTSTEVLGLTNNVAFLVATLDTPEFHSGRYDTSFVARFKAAAAAALAAQGASGSAAAATADAKRHAAAVVATFWTWALRTRTRKTWGHVPSGFRNMPGAATQRRILDVAVRRFEPESDKGRRLALEYDVTRSKAGAGAPGGYSVVGAVDGAEIRYALSSVKPVEVKKGAKPPIRTVNDKELVSGSAVLWNVQFEADESSRVTGGIVKLQCDGISRFYSVAVSSDVPDTYTDLLDVHCRDWDGETVSVGVVDPLRSAAGDAGNEERVHITPMPCRILAINAPTGSKVQPGDAILTVESMKMETKIRARVAGTVSIKVAVNDVVNAGVVIAEIDE